MVYTLSREREHVLLLYSHTVNNNKVMMILNFSYLYTVRVCIIHFEFCYIFILRVYAIIIISIHCDSMITSI